MVKVVLVGAGSYAWAPTLLCRILDQQALDSALVVMHDINAEALELTFELAQRLRATAKAATRFERTTDRRAALDGADVVVVTISTGGLAAMRHDLEIPERYGIFQTVGDTAGPGGLSRALRNIPVFLDIARDMQELCPEAWMINLSNPLCALTRAVNKYTTIRCLGSCHGVVSTASTYAAFFGVPLSQCQYVNSGIDHCSWFTRFLVEGQEAWERLREQEVDEWLTMSAPQAREHPVFSPLVHLRVGMIVGRQLGVLPAIGDRHLCEFLSGFLHSQQSVEKWGLVRTTVEERERNVAAARARIEGMLSGAEPLPGLRGTSHTVPGHRDDVGSWIVALCEGEAVDDNLHVPNIGQIPQLPAQAIVETRGMLDRMGPRPIVSPLPPALEALVRPHVLREELTVEAAVEGDLEKAVAALATDPLLHSPDQARPMLTEMLRATRQWLPPSSPLRSL